MIDFKLSTLNHVVAIQALLPRFPAEAAMDLASLVLDVRARGRYYRLLPQFFYCGSGRRWYSPKAGPNVRGFIGWRPYFRKRWPAGCGKFAFKDFCAAHGLPAPAYSRLSPSGMRAFVIKEDSSSFGQGLWGPFNGHEQLKTLRRLSSNGYYEEFISGLVIKAWYWNDRLLCLESEPMPAITGDGKNSLRDLISRRSRAEPSPADWAAYSQVLAFQGAAPEDIPASGKTLLADFRYGTLLNRKEHGTTDELRKMKDHPIAIQLERMGRILCLSIPQELRGPGTLYTLDAIADDKDKVWLLEMNSNPQVHPDAYHGMFEGLFGPLEAPRRHPVAVRLPIAGTANSLLRLC